MARKEKIVTIPDGRDKGKTFIIREMPASQAEKWAIRALLAISANAEIPDDVAEQGMAGLASMMNNPLALVKGLSFYDAEPLLDEMFACVLIKEDLIERAPTDDDIMDVKTRFTLRGEVMKLHVDFTPAASPSASESLTDPADLARTRMSRRQSAR